MKCPKCGGEQSIKYGRARGKQRYKCVACGCQFTSEHLRARVDEEKNFALSLLASGLSLCAVAKIMGVSVTSVWRWRKSVDSERIVKALRIRKISSTGKVKVVKNNDPENEKADDFEYGDVYSLETRLPSGLRVDIVVKRKAKNITK